MTHTDSQEATPITHLAIVLDRSGSMRAIRREAVDVLNAQIEAMRRESEGQTVRASFVTFSTSVDVPIVWEEAPGVLEPIDLADYRPAGMTAMLDAVGRTVRDLRALPDAQREESAFLVVVISDGQENNSRHETWGSIAELIQACEATGRWTFVYQGAGHDLADVQRALRLDARNVRPFLADRRGTRAMGDRLSKGTAGYLAKRKRGLTSSRDFFEEGRS